MEPVAHKTRFRDCPQCGNPLPVDAVECPQCGARLVEVMVAEREALRERRFIGALISRNARLTPVFIGANLLLFALMWLAGGMGLLSADKPVLIGFGAKVNDLIGQGQYWRLITCIFLHIGFLHLFFNNYALWIIGQEIERFYGSSRFVLIYLLTGMAGSTASYLFSPSDSAGASGAIFGLFGVMVTFPYRYRKEIPDALRKGIIRSMLPVILLNLGLGFTVPMIDQSAHIGGLVAGVALALVIPYKRPDERVTALVWRALCVICLTLIALSFIAVFSSYKMPPLKMENLTVSPGKAVIDYWERMNLGLASLRESDEAFKPILEERSGEAASDALKKVERGIDILESSPSIDEEADSYRHRLLDLLAEQKNLLEKYNRSDDRDWNALMRERNSIIARANQFIKEFEAWASGFLEKHGLRLTDESGNDL